MVDIESNILQNLNKGKESALKEVYRLFFMRYVRLEPVS